MPNQLVPVLYADIDGTIRHGKDELGRFVNTFEDVQVFDEVPELLKMYKHLGWRVIGISNQKGIALGDMTQEDCMQAMGETQRQCGFTFDKIVFCPHHPDDDCYCRKPKTGMIEDARSWLFQVYGDAYPLKMGLFVGDRPEDEACALNAGLQFMTAKTWRRGVHLDSIMAERNRTLGFARNELVEEK